MAMRSPGPENCLSFDRHEEAAGTRMLPWTSEGQKGAVAVVGSLNMPRDPFLGEYEGPSVSTRQGYLQGVRFVTSTSFGPNAAAWNYGVAHVESVKCSSQALLGAH